jgi:hypothetical protein
VNDWQFAPSVRSSTQGLGFCGRCSQNCKNVLCPEQSWKVFSSSLWPIPNAIALPYAAPFFRYVIATFRPFESILAKLIIAFAGRHSPFAVAFANCLCPTPRVDGTESNSVQLLDEDAWKLPRWAMLQASEEFPGL